MNPGFSTPPGFIEYCEDIVNNDKINTVAKLKEFWLYAIEVGKDNKPKMRDGIARCAIYVADHTKIPKVDIGYHSKDKRIWLAYDFINSYIFFNYDNPHHTSDNQWEIIEEIIKEIDENNIVASGDSVISKAARKIIKKSRRRAKLRFRISDTLYCIGYFIGFIFSPFYALLKRYSVSNKKRRANKKS